MLTYTYIRSYPVLLLIFVCHMLMFVYHTIRCHIYYHICYLICPINCWVKKLLLYCLPTNASVASSQSVIGMLCMPCLLWVPCEGYYIFLMFCTLPSSSATRRCRERNLSHGWRMLSACVPIPKFPSEHLENVISVTRNQKQTRHAQPYPHNLRRSHDPFAQ